MLAAIKSNRNSIGVETEDYYCQSTLQRLEDNRDLFSDYKVYYKNLSAEKDYEDSNLIEY